MNEINLEPIGDTALVEVSPSYKYAVTPDQRYSSATSGKVISVGNDDYDMLVGKLAYWEEYKDGTRTELNGKKYAFIKLEDIRGYGK